MTQLIQTTKYGASYLIFFFGASYLIKKLHYNETCDNTLTSAI